MIRQNSRPRTIALAHITTFRHACMSYTSLSSLRDVTLAWVSAMAEMGFAGSLIILALIVLWARGHSRLAFCWGAGIMAALTAALLLKGIMADSVSMPHFPSGHVVLAVVFYGALVLILLPRGVAWAAALLVLGMVALAEGVSRVALTEHGWFDVAGGFAVGVAGLLLTGNPWSWSGITDRDRLWLTGALVTGAPFASLANSDVVPFIRGLVGV